MSEPHPTITPDQFAARQRRNDWHPLTCGNRAGHPFEEEYGDHGVLRLRPDGKTMFCGHCDYTQPLPDSDIIHTLNTTQPTANPTNPRQPNHE